MHPKTSGIGAALLAVFVLAGALSGSGHKNKPAAADAPTASVAPSQEPATSATSPAPTPTTPTPTTPTLTSSAARSASPGKISAAPVDRTQRGRITALTLLATIPIKGRAAQTGYDRDQFGTAWTDDNNDPLGHNGCDTRNDVLGRDLSGVVFKAGSNGCAVLTGVLRDPYTATTIRFTRGSSTSTAVQIDHVVSLSDAWQTGASRWTEQTRTDLANDPLNLLAVDGPTNESKGDGDTATWLPPNKAYRCAYVARQVAVKARYQIWATQAEHDAMSRVLSMCPNQAAPIESGAAHIDITPPRTATPTPRRSTAAPIQTRTPPSDVYYENCDAVRAAGAAPIHLGDPGYSAHLDRDGDGIACE